MEQDCNRQQGAGPEPQAGVGSSETAPSPTVQVPQGEYEELKAKAAERDEYFHRLQRAVADYHNLLRRADRMRETSGTDAMRRVAQHVGPLADTLTRALEAAAQVESAEPTVEALKIIEKEFYDMLAGMGIEVIKAVGQPFDPHYHEAVMQQAVEGVAPHTVIAELKKGFMMGEDVIRHAQVAVAAVQAPRDGGAEREQ